MEEVQDEMGEEREDWDSVDRMVAQFGNNNYLDTTWQVMGQHRAYLSTFLRTHSMLLRGDGPLAAPVRHYLALMAAARHGCAHLVDSHRLDFLADGGDPAWIRDGLAAVPAKIRALSELNKLLAHRPWAIAPAHIEALTHSPSPGNWSLSELVYAIVLMAHFHAFSSFIESCVLMETTYGQGGRTKPECGAGWRRSTSRHNSERSLDGSPVEDFINAPSYDCTTHRKGGEKSSPDSVDTLLQKMESFRTQATLPDSEELTARFRLAVELSSGEGAGTTTSTTTSSSQEDKTAATDITKFVIEPDFQYVDFAQRDKQSSYSTFRIQDYNWDEQGYSLMSRFYDDIAQLLDDKFRTTYNLTYGTMGQLTAIDTTLFRRATWNYIQCLYGIRWDDYDYAEVNDLLHRSLKKYIKTAACYPERCAPDEYRTIMPDFLPSEKIHVCLITSEAKFQSELLYALRAVATHFSSCKR